MSEQNELSRPQTNPVKKMDVHACVKDLFIGGKMDTYQK